MKEILYKGSYKNYLMVGIDYVNDFPFDEEESKRIYNSMCRNATDNCKILKVYPFYNEKAEDGLVYIHKDIFIIDIPTNFDMYWKIYAKNFSSPENENFGVFNMFFTSASHPGGLVKRVYNSSNYRDYIDVVNKDKCISIILKKSQLKSGISPNHHYNGCVPSIDTIIYAEDNFEYAINNIESGYILKEIIRCTKDYRGILAKKQEKIYCKYQNSTYFISDGKSSLENITSYYKNDILNYDLVLISQFNKQDCMIHNLSGFRNILQLKLICKNKIKEMKSVKIKDSGLYFETAFINRKNKSVFDYVQLSFCSNTQKIIIPYSDKENCKEQALELVKKMLSFDDNFKEYCKEYCYNCITNPTVIAEGKELLSTWFKATIENKKNEQQEILNGYNKLKADLLKEQEELKIYLNNVDLSKKRPIPTLKIRGKHNYYNFHNSSNSLNKFGSFKTNNSIVNSILFAYLPGEYRSFNIEKYYDEKNNEINIKWGDLKC